jgi:hypothetical protein
MLKKTPPSLHEQTGKGGHLLKMAVLEKRLFENRVQLAVELPVRVSMHQ